MTAIHNSKPSVFYKLPIQAGEMRTTPIEASWLPGRERPIENRKALAEQSFPELFALVTKGSDLVAEIYRSGLVIAPYGTELPTFPQQGGGTKTPEKIADYIAEFSGGETVLSSSPFATQLLASLAKAEEAPK